MSLTFTILGCGSSMGVPRVALGWGSCDPNNPKNRRRRCSLLVERVQGARARPRAFWSIARRICACSFWMREVDGLDGVLITHEHADHTHGIDDLRPLFVHQAPPRRRLSGRADVALHACSLRLLLYDPAGQRIPADCHRKASCCRQVSVTIDGQGGPIEAPAGSAGSWRHPVPRLPVWQRRLFG